MKRTPFSWFPGVVLNAPRLLPTWFFHHTLVFRKFSGAPGTASTTDADGLVLYIPDYTCAVLVSVSGLDRFWDGFRHSDYPPSPYHAIVRCFLYDPATTPLTWHIAGSNLFDIGFAITTTPAVLNAYFADQQRVLAFLRLTLYHLPVFCACCNLHSSAYTITIALPSYWFVSMGS